MEYVAVEKDDGNNFAFEYGNMAIRWDFPLKSFPNVTLAVGELVRRNHYQLTLIPFAQTAQQFGPTHTTTRRSLAPSPTASPIHQATVNILGGGK